MLLRSRRRRTNAQLGETLTSKTVLSRAELLLATLEDQALSRIRTLLGRLDIPSRQDLDALTRRVRRLEHQLQPRAHPPISARGADQHRRATGNAPQRMTKGTASRTRSLEQ
jgi:hypothetical protein